MHALQCITQTATSPKYIAAFLLPDSRELVNRTVPSWQRWMVHGLAWFLLQHYSVKAVAVSQKTLLAHLCHRPALPLEIHSFLALSFRSTAPCGDSSSLPPSIICCEHAFRFLLNPHFLHSLPTTDTESAYRFPIHIPIFS